MKQEALPRQGQGRKSPACIRLSPCNGALVGFASRNIFIWFADPFGREALWFWIT
jgi:hypothetical protein